MESLDIAPLMVWAAVLLTLLNLGTNLWSIFSSGARKNDARITALDVKFEALAKAQDQRVELAERRLQRTEDHVEQLPSGEMLHRLELSMARMEGHIDRLDERLKPVTAIAERMQELMLEQSRGR